MKNFHCKMFGHDFHVTRNVTSHVKEYTCKNCKKELTTSSRGKLIELTPKYKEINDVLEHIHYTKGKTKTNKQIATSDLLVFSH